MRIPTIQINLQPARLGMDTTPFKLETEQPHATFELSTKAPTVNIHSQSGDLRIDQSRAWDALAVGSHLNTMNSIFRIVKNIVLNTIGRIAEEGNQLAAIHLNTNAIADIAQNRTVDRIELAFAGPAGPDNVDIQYTAHAPEFEPVAGEMNLRVDPNQPRHQFTRGKLDIYMLQYHRVEIIPPQIDLQI
ncbi:MAG: DUF6470 family protein [Paenibacillaceae bacterium]